ncbi:MAG TPA: hypothetical protein PKZ76_14945 [Xanthomonadaceae bacterium]|nr:hypothetical protein [Xanthomonadaceae bacterium]
MRLAPAAALVAALAGASAPSAAPYDRDPPGSYADYVMELGPVAWWRLGEDASSTFADSSGRGHTGFAACTNPPTPGEPGAVVGDADAAIAISAALQQCVEVPSHSDFSLGKARDDFERVVAPGSTWGSAPVGGTWTPAFTVGGNFYACADGTATIDQTAVAATWGQTLAVERTDVDVQIAAAWDQSASGGQIAPVALLARFQDSANYYRAELRESPGGSLTLRLLRTVDGQTAVLASESDIGSHVAGDWWYLRFQVEGETLRARAWNTSATQPVAWTLSTSDDAIVASGSVGVRSSNSGSDSRPLVSFANFRVQSVGMSVHACMRPHQLTFPGQQDNYVHWLGKGIAGQHEWVLRFYSLDSSRPNRTSAYIFNRSGGLGAGAYVQESLVDHAWMCLVAVFDPGDRIDPGAGVALYKNGARRHGPPSSGTLYSNQDYLVTPEHAAAPLRIGTRDGGSYLTGGIDEVQIYDRRLSEAEVAELYHRLSAKPPLAVFADGFEG